MRFHPSEDPRAIDVVFENDLLVVVLDDGRRVCVPLCWSDRLFRACRSDLEDWRLVGDGRGIHWNQLDEDLAVEALLVPPSMLACRDGSQATMRRLDDLLRKLGVDPDAEDEPEFPDVHFAEGDFTGVLPDDDGRQRSIAAEIPRYLREPGDDT
jgi:hypothetical protein